MKAFPDTSFLCALYRSQINSPQADAWVSASHAPLPVSSLLLLEFRQSVRFQGWLHAKDPTRGLSLPLGLLMLRDIQSDISSGVVEVVPVEWAEVHLIAEPLSARRTGNRGHRLVDILHVATALHLGAEAFLSFDENQRHLAAAEGLSLPV